MTPKKVAPLRSVMLTREDVPGATDVKWSDISGYQSNCAAADNDLNLTLSPNPETQLSVGRFEGDGMSVTQVMIFNLIESDKGGRVRGLQADVVACDGVESTENRPWPDRPVPAPGEQVSVAMSALEPDSLPRGAFCLGAPSVSGSGPPREPVSLSWTWSMPLSGAETRWASS